MTRQPDFTGVWIKVERAKHHFRDLQALYERLDEDNPYEAIPYDEPDTGDLVYKAKIPNEPPLWWSAITGDCVHYLRSSLDLLVCEMVCAGGERVTSGTGFPIFRSKAACTNAFRTGPPGEIKGVPQGAVKLIKRANPDQGANNPFWRLRELDIADKHKLLLPVGIVPTHITDQFTLDQLFAANPGASEGSLAELMGDRPEGIVMPRHPFPLKDGAVIYRIPASLRSNPKAQMYMNPKFKIQVAFGEVEVVKGKELIPTLNELIQFVERFIKLFPPLFSQGWLP